MKYGILMVSREGTRMEDGTISFRFGVNTGMGEVGFLSILPTCKGSLGASFAALNPHPLELPI
jgi:hypothetical protein